MTLFAVHHCFDCLDYNEHYYFKSFGEALDLLNEIKEAIKTHRTIVETYTDSTDEFYVHLDDGLEKVYIQPINV
jgi:hypothetical protein